MTAAHPAERRVDFAVLGNGRSTMRWLELVLAAMPEVQMVTTGTGTAPEPPAPGVVTGMIVTGLGDGAAGRAVAAADRLAVVLEDPVGLLARDGGDTGEVSAVGRYAGVLRPLLAGDGDRVLVLAADELAQPSSEIGALLTHLGVQRAAGLETLATASPPGELRHSERSTLFARVRDDVEELEQLSGRTFRSWRYAEPAPAAAARAAGGAAVVYVGRRRDVEVPPGQVGLDDWQVLPVTLGPLLESAASLTIHDPMSFPFDALRAGDREIPLAVQLPGGWDAPALIDLLGVPLLTEIGGFDAVAVSDDSVWRDLREQYSWPSRIRISNGALAGFPIRVGLDPRGPVRVAKATRRRLGRATEGQVAAGLAGIAPSERPNALLLGDDVECWAGVLPLAGASLLGIGTRAENVRLAARSYPEWRFQTTLPDEAELAHVALSVQALCTAPGDLRRQRLRALTRGLRVGGRLILLERFLQGRGGRTIGAPRPRELLAEVRHATDGHAVLEHVEALRLDGDDVSSFGLFAFTKLGRPERL